MRRLRIAMVGLRGLPATYGGIERHVEELGSRLAERGHEVTVFCRPDYTSERGVYRGMRLVPLPTASSKHLEATVHSAIAAAATVGRGYDIVHFHALGPGLFSPIPKLLTRAGVVQTIHGLDDQRSKWGGGAQQVLGLARRLSARVPDEVVVVSEELRRVYQDEHGRRTTYVPNGAPQVSLREPGEVLVRLGLQAGRYLLFLGRLVPEKDPALLLRAFARVETDQRLVLVGGSSHTDDYAQTLSELAQQDPRVVMAGYLYGDDLTEVMSSAGLFVQPSLLEGLPITLLEAAAFELPVVVSDIAPHQEVVPVSGPGRRVFPAGELDGLAEALRAELTAPEASRVGGLALSADVRKRYDWDDATERLERVYRAAARRSR